MRSMRVAWLSMTPGGWISPVPLSTPPSRMVRTLDMLTEMAVGSWSVISMATATLPALMPVRLPGVPWGNSGAGGGGGAAAAPGGGTAPGTDGAGAVVALPGALPGVEGVEAAFT